MKILVINPNRSDFIYDSVAYKLLGRKNLKKYKYLQDFVLKNDSYFYFNKSSFHNILKSIKLNFIDYILLKIEVLLFYKINPNLNIPIISKRDLDSFDVVFCFGFAIRDIPYHDLEFISKQSKLFIIHLSHYHIFADKINSWSLLENVKFCSDTDITENIFFNYFTDKKINHFVLSYIIDKKFCMINKWEDRNFKIISTGTFHQFEKFMSIKEIKESLISGIFNSLSLHPERRLIYAYSKKLKFLDCFNSPMGGIKFIGNKKNVSQKDYFKIDIVSLYNNYKFAFIGEESIIGVPGIGIYEAVLCGCIPIINNKYYLGTPLYNNNLTVRYDNVDELLSIIKNFDKIKLPEFSNSEFINLINEVQFFFSEENQLNNLNREIALTLN